MQWSLSLCFSLSLHLSLYLSLSDKLGDSLFCRKCSPHTDCRLVCSRFNLIIASPAFNQPASVCFMLKLCYKYKIDTRRLAKLAQKSSTETQDEMEFFLIKIQYLCFQSLRQGCKKVKGEIFVLCWEDYGLQDREPQRDRPLLLPLVKTDTYLFAYMGVHWLHLCFPEKHMHKYTLREQQDGYCRCVRILQCGNFQRPWSMQVVMSGLIGSP